MIKTTYVPILKWKKGEQEALKNIPNKYKETLTPLIEITDYIEPNKISNTLEKCFNNPVYVDTIIASEDDRSYLLSILSHFHIINKTIYPILYVDDLNSINTNLSDITNKIAVRISIPEDIDGPDYSETFKIIKDFHKNSNVTIDLILDLGFILEKREANRQYSEVKMIINNYLINESFYNSLIISSTSFPEDLSSVNAGDCVSFNRYEMKLFTKLVSLFPDLKDKLVFSDFGVTKFTDTDMDFSKMRYGILPKIKYTTKDKYYVLKGKRNHVTRELSIGYIELSNTILSSDIYFGENFSFGDSEIYEIGNQINKKRTGNNQNWVTISANHHIAVSAEQLSKIL
ncbi:hypothetical protein CF098_07615 [Clostridium sporogenes]